MTDYTDFYASEKYADCKLLLDDEVKLPGHKLILGRRSAYFEHIFSDAQVSKVDLRNFKGSVILDLLRWCYTNELPPTLSNNLLAEYLLLDDTLQLRGFLFALVLHPSCELTGTSIQQLLQRLIDKVGHLNQAAVKFYRAWRSLQPAIECQLDPNWRYQLSRTFLRKCYSWHFLLFLLRPELKLAELTKEQYWLPEKDCSEVTVGDPWLPWSGIKLRKKVYRQMHLQPEKYFRDETLVSQLTRAVQFIFKQYEVATSITETNFEDLDLHVQQLLDTYLVQAIVDHVADSNQN